MKYARLLSRLEGQPLMIAEAKLRVITEKVTIPLLQGMAPDDQSPSMAYATKKPVVQSNARLAVIEVFDSLVSKNASAASGMTSYEGIANQIDAAIAAGATDIGFYIDSPGGEVSGLFGLTEKIRALSASGISTFSFTDGMMTSAAQAIGAATGTSYASPTALVGSIAAIMVHAESSQRDATQGITYSIFRSKEEKALADSKTPLSDTAKEKITSMLASMDTAFNNDMVASRPNLTVDSIISMKGSEFMAAEGLKLGLIDALMPNMDAVLSHRYKTSTQTKGVKMKEELEKAQAALAESQTALATAQAAIETTRTEATTAERARCTAIIDAGVKLNLETEIVSKHITAGYSNELSLDVMTQIASSKTDATAIDASKGIHASVQGAVGSDPITNASSLAAAYTQATGRKLTAQL